MGLFSDDPPEAPAPAPPPPEPPKEVDPEIRKSRTSARKRLRAAAGGRTASILTSPLGLPSEDSGNAGKKVILGR